jgi:hypothetical protein
MRRAALRLPVFSEERKDGRLVGCQTGVEPEHDARLALHLVLGIGVDQEARRERSTPAAGSITYGT